jgi:pyridoxamine 5'-phosphate oxidase family protein
MSVFTENEIEYMKEQRLGRLATVDAEGRPHVVPVGFRYNAERDAVDIGGHNLAGSKKFRDAGRTGKAAFVVDDVLPPWRARGARSGAGPKSFRRADARSWRTSRRS